MPDLRIANHGTVALIRPLTPRGQRWIERRVEGESWQWFGGALAAEPRYVQPLIDGAESEGLTVEA